MRGDPESDSKFHKRFSLVTEKLNRIWLGNVLWMPWTENAGIDLDDRYSQQLSLTFFAHPWQAVEFTPRLAVELKGVKENPKGPYLVRQPGVLRAESFKVFDHQLVTYGDHFKDSAVVPFWAFLIYEVSEEGVGLAKKRILRDMPLPPEIYKVVEPHILCRRVWFFEWSFINNFESRDTKRDGPLKHVLSRQFPPEEEFTRFEVPKGEIHVRPGTRMEGRLRLIASSGESLLEEISGDPDIGLNVDLETGELSRLRYVDGAYAPAEL
tara:strand:+ start:56 stop:856 length:801 start_codon:yes stop_codon:yes gene_type:complete